MPKKKKHGWLHTVLFTPFMQLPFLYFTIFLLALMNYVHMSGRIDGIKLMNNQCDPYKQFYQCVMDETDRRQCNRDLNMILNPWLYNALNP